MTKRWTEKELQFLIDNAEILTNAELADEIGKSRSAIANKKNKEGLTGAGRKRKTYEVIRGYEVLATGTVEECAEQTGLAVNTIWFYTSEAYRKRVVDLDKAILVYKVDD